MTQIQVPGVLDRTYTFSSTNNDGRITQMADAVSGEIVVYQYDSLKRLISAETTGPQWGQSFGYDAYGNLLNQTVTKGSAPSMSLTVNPANNQVSNGPSYDFNGNFIVSSSQTLTYDVENRLVRSWHSSNGTERYVYSPSNERVWKQEPSRTLVYFYGVEGNLLATYGDGANNDYNVYFGAKLVWAEASPGIAAGPVTLDHLGSAVRHFPYGDEPSTTGQDRVKFATYYRDQTSTLDYARNRYYSSTIARFTTPDPYVASGGPADPQSWNRYSYTRGDPVNRLDPSGFADCPAEFGGACFSVDGTGRYPSDPLAEALRNHYAAGFRSGFSFNLEWLPEGAYGGGDDVAKRDFCDRNDPTNAKIFNYIETYSASAQKLSAQSGLSADFILAWGGYESGYGTGPTVPLNNFFGLTISDPEKSGWIGAVPCPPGSPDFACFSAGGEGAFVNSGVAALFSQNQRYLTPALAAQQAGGDARAIASAIAGAGFNSEPYRDYAGDVAGAYTAIQRRKGCP